MRHRRWDEVAVGVLGTGHHLPPRVVRTEALFPGPLAEELVRLTGIRARHVADDQHATSDLVIAACEAALQGLPRDQVDRVLVATVTGDHPSPGTAPLVQHGLGLERVPAVDLGAACAGLVSGLELAVRCVATGDRLVLVGAGECRFRTLEQAAPGVRALFGDGASALVLGPLPAGARGLRVRATVVGADGRGHGATRVPAGGSRLPTSAATVAAGQHALAMSDGPQVFFEAVEGLAEVAQALLEPLGLRPADVDLVVPHQPNRRILERVARVLRVPWERFAVEVETVGNVGGASVGVALDRAWRSGRIGPGARVMLLTAGAGYTAAAALLEAA